MGYYESNLKTSQLFINPTARKVDSQSDTMMLQAHNNYLLEGYT